MSNTADTAEADRIATALGPRPLPVEGGGWAQTRRDEHRTGSYYLLVAPDFSASQRLPLAEPWVSHAGAPARPTLPHDGAGARPVQGMDLAAGQRPRVPAGTWQVCRPLGAAAHPAHAAEIRALCRER
jgi:predicted cupin superfamily sugar epimerase